MNAVDHEIGHRIFAPPAALVLEQSFHLCSWVRASQCEHACKSVRAGLSVCSCAQNERASEPHVCGKPRERTARGQRRQAQGTGRRGRARPTGGCQARACTPSPQSVVNCESKRVRWQIKTVHVARDNSDPFGRLNFKRFHDGRCSWVPRATTSTCNLASLLPPPPASSCRW